MRATAIAMICSLLSAGASNAFAQEVAAWQQVAAGIPLGSKVKVETLSGDRMTATLMSVRGEGVVVKQNTRWPVAAITIPFAEVARIERDNNKGVNVGKAIAIGLAAGAGVVLGLFVIAMQLD